MRRAIIIAAAASALLATAAAAPALAGYGAVARDEATGKYGVSWNEPNQKQAEEAAVKGCNAAGCKVIFRVGPKQCGALATTEDGKVWGGSTRPTKPAAELGAIQGCQKRTKAQCKVRGSECNK